MPTRRDFIKMSGAAGVAFYLTSKTGWVRRAFAAIDGGSLMPSDVTKYVLPLVKPPAMTLGSKGRDRGYDWYEIAVRQFDQRILSPPHPMTTVWSYGNIKQPGTVAEGGSFNYPAFTIEANYEREVRVRWINDLLAKNDKYLPHLLSVDQTLHWANPPGGLAMRDRRGTDRSFLPGVCTPAASR